MLTPRSAISSTKARVPAGSDERASREVNLLFGVISPLASRSNEALRRRGPGLAPLANCPTIATSAAGRVAPPE